MRSRSPRRTARLWPGKGASRIVGAAASLASAAWTTPSAGRPGRSRTGSPRVAMTPPLTPDGRYIVVRGRLWRRADPDLPEDARERYVAALMAARRAVRTALGTQDAGALSAARSAVQAAKVALGERGPPWWDDGQDFNRYLAKNTPYAAWYAARDTTD